MKNELREIYDFDKERLEEAEGKKKAIKFKAPFLVADDVNRNKRRYPLDVVRNAVTAFNKKVEQGQAWGGDKHPRTGHLETENVSHRINKIWLKDRTAWIEGTILADTPEGKKILSMIESGGTLGISARGFGTGTKSEGVTEINPDYVLAGVDFVINPSVDIAQVNAENIFESAPVEEPEDYDVDVDQFETMVESECAKHFRIEAEINPAMKGTPQEFEEYKREHENFYREALISALQENGYSLAPEILEGQKDSNPELEQEYLKAEAELSGMTAEQYEKTLKKEDKELKARYLEAVSAGYQKDFETYKKEVLKR